jgi:hypothetical protein
MRKHPEEYLGPEKGLAELFDDKHAKIKPVPA